LHAQRGTPPNDAKRKSHGRNNFDGHERKPSQAKLKNPRAPNHFAPEVPQPTAQNPRLGDVPVLRKTPEGNYAQYVPSPWNRNQEAVE